MGFSSLGASGSPALLSLLLQTHTPFSWPHVPRAIAAFSYVGPRLQAPLAHGRSVSPEQSSPPGCRVFFLDRVGILEIVWSSPSPRKKTIKTWSQRTRVTVRMGATPYNSRLPDVQSGLSPACQMKSGLFVWH